MTRLPAIPYQTDYRRTTGTQVSVRGRAAAYKQTHGCRAMSHRSPDGE